MSGATALHGARVLVRAHNLRHEYLNSFLAYAQRTAGWTLGMIADRPYPAFCEGLEVRRENFFLTPNVLKPGDFQSDEAQLRRMRDLVAACERSTGIPVHRIVLADERNSGRAYAIEFYHWPSTTAAAAVLRDNSISERNALRLFAGASDILERFQPEFVIIGGHTSMPDSFALRMVAEHLGIPVLISRPSKILPCRCFWTLDLEMLNTSAAALCAKKIGRGLIPEKQAYAHITRFRETPATIDYIQQNWKVAAAKGVVSTLRDLAYRLRRQIEWLRLGQHGQRGKPVVSKAWETFRSAWLVRRQKPLFQTFQDDELASTRYIYIALHKEPELAINFQAPFWHSQKNLIAWLSMNLPCGYRLLVRDHRMNEGRRPTRYYRDLLAYPGVALVSPIDSQFKYIRNAELIVADNGTTGWEGLVFGKRVLSLARNFYEPAGLANQVTDPSQLGEAVVRILAEPKLPDRSEWERRLACLVEAEMETTVTEDESSHEISLEMVASMLPGLVRPRAKRLDQPLSLHLGR
jgi:hypothetical protein